MNKFWGVLTVVFVMLLAGENTASAQTSIFDRLKARRIEKRMSGNKRKDTKEKKIREPRSVTKAKKEQARREADKKNDYKKAVQDNRQRHYDIQSDEVKERMKQNEKDIKTREKEKRKAERKAGRMARKKYKNN